MLPRLLLAVIACGKGRRTQLSDYTGLIDAWQCADITQRTFSSSAAIIDWKAVGDYVAAGASRQRAGANASSGGA
jgi:hypothetical protein